jgi:hypothetical protein
VPDELIVSGTWESKEGLDVSIGSQLITSDQVRLAAHAVYSADPFFAYFPPPDHELEEDETDRRDSLERDILTNWLVREDHLYARIDRNDPYGFPTALKRTARTRKSPPSAGLHPVIRSSGPG